MWKRSCCRRFLTQRKDLSFLDIAMNLRYCTISLTSRYLCACWIVKISIGNRVPAEETVREDAVPYLGNMLDRKQAAFQEENAQVAEWVTDWEETAACRKQLTVGFVQECLVLYLRNRVSLHCPVSRKQFQPSFSSGFYHDSRD